MSRFKREVYLKYFKYISNLLSKINVVDTITQILSLVIFGQLVCLYYKVDISESTKGKYDYQTGASNVTDDCLYRFATLRNLIIHGTNSKCSTFMEIYEEIISLINRCNSEYVALNEYVKSIDLVLFKETCEFLDSCNDNYKSSITSILDSMCYK